jgi:uncharacterized protein (PEP-CTERM system associated)
MENGRAPFPSLFAASAVTWVTLALPGPTAAADWQIHPGIDARETYTDNLRLSPPGSERGDFVTEITPRISVTGQSSRLKVNAAYSMRNFFYAREDGASDTLHQLSGAARAELIDDLFFVDGSAGISPQAISAFGPQLVDQGHLTENRAEVRTYSLSPYLRHRFGSQAVAEARFAHDSVSADRGGLQDSQSNRVHVGVSSGPAFRNLQWEASYDQRKTDYRNVDDVETSRYSGTVRYQVTPLVGVNATAGHEDNNYLSIGEKPSGSFWSMFRSAPASAFLAIRWHSVPCIARA